MKKTRLDQKGETFDETWEKTYKRGEQLNRYPYSDIVSFLYRYQPKNKPAQNTKILEVGCGAGNNLWFAAREGFDVVGIDASHSAIDYANSRFKEDGLAGVFEVGDFTDLPYADSSFDIILERAAITQTSKYFSRIAVQEMYRTLAPEGLLFSQIYSDRSSSRGKLSADGCLEDIEGPLSGNGKTALYSKSEIRDLFADYFSVDVLNHTETVTVSDSPHEILAYWTIIGSKLSVENV